MYTMALLMTSFLGGLMLWFQSRSDHPQYELPRPFSLTSLYSEPSLTLRQGFRTRSYLIPYALLVGLLSVPLNPLFAERIVQMSLDEKMVSLFWLFSGLSAFASVSWFRRTQNSNDLRTPFTITLFSVISLLAGLTVNSTIFCLVSACLYVFTSQIYSVKLQLTLTSETQKRETLGSTLGVLNFTTDLGIFLGMAFNTLLFPKYRLAGLIILASLVLIRSRLSIRVSKVFHSIN